MVVEALLQQAIYVLIPVVLFLVPDGNLGYNVGNDGTWKVWGAAVILNLKTTVWKQQQFFADSYTSEFL